MKLRPFELGLIIVFAVLLLGSIVLLRTYDIGDEPTDPALTTGVTVWGTLPADTFERILLDLAGQNDVYRNVTYRYVREEDFDNELLNALADQQSPDMVLMSSEKLVEHRNRLFPISYETFPERDFRNLYVDGASVFALDNGIYGFPIAVDPLVMYWNRDIFSSNGFLTPPTTWEDLVNNIAPVITERDFNRNIDRATVAMGDFNNVKNAFPVISMLLAQAGSKFAIPKGNLYTLDLNIRLDGSTGAFTNTLTFYSNFSNINNTLYSWNRSLPLDRDMFLSEDLALYFGYGSEARDLEAKNPNLSFDIAEVPQAQDASNKRTYGKYYGFFILKAAPNKAGAYSVIQTLSQPAFAKRIADTNNLAPVHRSLLQQGSNDVYGRVIYSSAFNTKAWLNPDLDRLDDVFTKALEDISANRRDINSVVGDTNIRLRQIY
ncbi:MAG: carbohydrate ABC transporter substrate-binding protein [Candidatus Nomurabacteria bacterium]|nr:carbohydrate ABC transporter substrate-binding protein [Candidatus Nomurabacteria bacterium]USN87669.1 MAG: carbohydrate ABC transporter substrate-binding protein [Candidatus Nomurabacteria bacterium]